MSEVGNPDSAVGANFAEPPPGPEVLVVEGDASNLRLPDECASCGGFAGSSELVGSGARSLVIPYCGRCLRHASAARTRRLGALLASGLFAASVVGGGPLVSPWTGAVALTVAATIASLAPLAVSRWILPGWLPRRVRTRAVFVTGRGELAFRREAFAEKVAAANRGVALRVVRREEPLGLPAALGPVLALVGAPLVHWLHHPLVRVLNLGAESVVVEVDGRPVATVLGSSIESPAAGVELRLPAGRRHLVARTRTGPLADAQVSLRSGHQHLYAPGPHPHCFWLETVRYGRAGEPAIEREELPPAAGFWALPGTIDVWFAPSPAPQAAARASGGRLVALRQARCRDAPGMGAGP